MQGSEEGMPWKIEKEKLKKALAILDLVPPQPGLPSSEFFRIEGREGRTVWTVASNVTGIIEIIGKGKWPYKEPFYLDRRLFTPFVTVETKSKFPFEFKEGLWVRQGKRKAQFDKQAKISGYGFEPDGKLLEKVNLSEHIKELVYCARDCATEDPITPQLNCVYIQPNGKGTEVYATNQKIVYQGHSKTKAGIKKPIPMPLFLVTLIGHKELQEIHWKEKTMTLQFPKGQIWQTVSSKAAKGFPVESIKENMLKIQNYPLLFTIDSKRFVDILERLAGYLGAVKRQDWVLKLTGEKDNNEIKLSSRVPTGEFREIVKAARIFQDFNVEWPFDMVLPVFQYIKTRKESTVEVRSRKGITYVTSKDVRLAIPEREK